MEVKELQKKIISFIAQWDKKRNDESTEEKRFIHLVEEIGELATQYVNKETRPDQYKPEEVENAIGDSIMQLIKLADLRGLDVETILTKIIEEEQKLLK